MTRDQIQPGVVFNYRENSYMIEPNGENVQSGKLHLIQNNKPVFIGEYVWGLDPKLYVTTESFPGHKTTVAIWKRECKYVGKF